MSELSEDLFRESTEYICESEIIEGRYPSIVKTAQRISLEELDLWCREKLGVNTSLRDGVLMISPNVSTIEVKFEGNRLMARRRGLLLAESDLLGLSFDVENRRLRGIDIDLKGIKSTIKSLKEKN